MKSLVLPAVIAILLAAAGGIFWTEGRGETRLAEAHRQLAVLQYQEAAAAGGESADKTVLSRIRGLGGDAAADVRQLRTTAQYWDAEYDTLTPQRDAAGTITESDAAVLVVDANASFRTSQADADRSSALRRLDAVVKNYAEVLKANPGAPDVAYNYEYTVRVRDSLQKARGAASGKHPLAQKADSREEPSDLPAGPTVHGQPGGPPPKTDMSQFKIVIPKRGEERKDDPQAGKGGAKIRKG